MDTPQAPRPSPRRPGQAHQLVPPTLRTNVPDAYERTGYLHFTATDAYLWAVLPKPIRVRERFSIAGIPTFAKPFSSAVAEALVEDESAPLEWMVVTTPNSPYIPIPSLGIREVKPRANMFCGFEDRAQHPQHIVPRFEYIACIPRTFPDDLRWTPNPQDCASPSGSAIMTDYVMLKKVHISRLQTIQRFYANKVESLLQRFPSETHAASLRDLMNQNMRMLSRFTLTFREIQFILAEFKRTCLDIVALDEYITKYLPRTKGDIAFTHPPDDSLMGGFTENYTHAELFHRIGIPVFFIRPMSSITHATLIGKEVEFTRADIVIADASPPFPPLWTGPPSAKWHEVTQRVGWRTLDMINSSASLMVTDQGLTTETLQQSGPVRSQPSSSRTSPYPPSSKSSTKSTTSSKRSSPRPPSTNSKEVAPSDFVTPASEAFPPMHPSWRSGILAIQTSRNSPLRRHHPIAFFCPDPRAFALEHNRSPYLLTWAAIRVVHLANLSRHAVGIISYQSWKLSLNKIRNLHSRLEANSQPPSTTPGPSQLNESTQRRGKHRNANMYLDDLLAPAQLPASVAWFEQTIPIPVGADLKAAVSNAVSAEMIWEMCEVSFRFELRHLDRCLVPNLWAGSAEVARDEALRRIFPLESDGAPALMTLATFPNVNGGLVSNDFGETKRATLAFRDVVIDWPSCPSTIIAGCLSPEEPFVNALLSQIIIFYCQIFFDCFGRPPVAPHSLPPSALAREAPRQLADQVHHD